MSLAACSGRSSLAARSSSRLARVSHWPDLVRRPPGSLRLSNRNSPSCRGRAQIELVPGQRVDLLLQPGDALGERGGEPRQDRPVDLHARRAPSRRARRPWAAPASRRPSSCARPRGGASAPSTAAASRPRPRRRTPSPCRAAPGRRSCPTSWRRARAAAHARRECKCAPGGARKAHPSRAGRGRRRAHRRAAWCRRGARARCRTGAARGSRT